MFCWLYEYRTFASSIEDVTITVSDSDCGSDLDLSDSTSDKEGSGEEIKFNPLSLKLGEQISDSFDSLSVLDQEDPSVSSLTSRSVELIILFC